MSDLPKDLTKREWMATVFAQTILNQVAKELEPTREKIASCAVNMADALLAKLGENIPIDWNAISEQQRERKKNWDAGIAGIPPEPSA
jgi:hypothetical protein